MPKLCKDDMDFVDCQLAIVRERSDTISDIQKKNVAQDVIDKANGKVVA